MRLFFVIEEEAYHHNTTLLLFVTWPVKLEFLNHKILPLLKWNREREGDSLGRNIEKEMGRAGNVEETAKGFES